MSFKAPKAKLPRFMDYLLDVTDNIAEAVVLELRIRKLEKLQNEQIDMLEVLRTPCAEEELTTLDVELERMEKEKEYYTRELQILRKQKDESIKTLSLHPETFRSTLEFFNYRMDAPALILYGEGLVEWHRDNLPRMIDIRTKAWNVRKKRAERDKRLEVEYAPVRALLEEMVGMKERLLRISDSVKRSTGSQRDARSAAPSLQPDNTQEPQLEAPALTTCDKDVDGEQLVLPEDNISVSVPTEDAQSALSVRLEKLQADLQNFQETRQAYTTRSSNLKSRYNSETRALNQRIAERPLTPIREIHISEATLQEPIQEILQVGFNALSTEYLASLSRSSDTNKVFDQVIDRIADANRFMCKIAILSPEYIVEDGEIVSDSDS